MLKTRMRNSGPAHGAAEKKSQMPGSEMLERLTLRELDLRAVPRVEPLAPAEIKRIRESTHVSQAVFARLLNTSVSTVQKWEVGQKRPAGTALKLLHLVQQRGLGVIA